MRRQEEGEEVTEQWRTIPGFDDRYEVSNLGRFRSWHKKGPGGGRLEVPVIKPCEQPSSKYIVCAPKLLSGKRVSRNLHELVLLAFCGPPPSGHECRHLNGDGKDNRLSNLAWGTRTENAADKASHGTMASGEKNGRSKLSSSQVREIREHLSMGKSRRWLRKKYKVGKSQLQRIATGESWRDI